MQYEEAFMEYKESRWKIMRFWTTKKLSWKIKKPLWNTLDILGNTRKLDRKEAIVGHREAFM